MQEIDRLTLALGKVLCFSPSKLRDIDVIFTDEERRILEAYLTNNDFDKTVLSNLFDQIKKIQILFRYFPLPSNQKNNNFLKKSCFQCARA
jgi:hypothetical protein